MKALKVFVAVDCHRSRFGISCGEKLSIWYGPFGKFDVCSTEMDMQIAAMKKAVWVGKKVAEGMGVRWGLRLEIASDVSVPAKAAREIEMQGRWGKIYVSFTQIGAAANPAEVLCQAQDWCKADLERAARCVEESKYVPADG
jgi:hypothetical protein